MASDLPTYGLDADLKAKQDAAYDPELEKKVCEWIEAISGEPKGDASPEDWLHDGQVLCNLGNKIRPGAIKKINTSAMVFKQRENITYFQKFAREVGVPEISLFSTDDLFDAKNMNSVMKCMYIFGGVVQTNCPEFGGPKLGDAITAQVKDQKRAGGPVTQTGGLTGAMEVQKMTQGKREVASGGIGVSKPSEAAPDAAGIDRDLAEKMASKYDPALDKEACEWIEAISGQSKGSQSTQEWLKSGQVLCRLVNKLKPGMIPNINTMSTAFKERENITYFQDAMRKFGVPEGSLFGTDELYEGKNIGTFIAAVFAFGGAVQSNSDTADVTPKLGKPLTHKGDDTKREGLTATSQYESMQKGMQVERPKNTGITAGADAGA